MNPKAAATKGRRVARQMMTDVVDHVRPTGGFTDDGSGSLVPDTTTINADVPVWIRPLTNQVQVKDAAGDPVTLMAYDVLLPHDTSDIQLDDLFKVTTSAQTDLDGRTLTVIDPGVGTHQVARRIMVQLQTGSLNAGDGSS